MDSILEIICVVGLMAVNLAESKGLIDHSLEYWKSSSYIASGLKSRIQLLVWVITI